MGFSAVTIYSADGGGALSASNLGVRQVLYGSLGLVVMLFVASIDYRILGSLAWAAYGVAMVLLLLVLVPGVGVEDARLTEMVRPRVHDGPTFQSSPK